MKRTDNLDELINRYSSQLLDFGNRYGHSFDDKSEKDENLKEKETLSDADSEDDRELTIDSDEQTEKPEKQKEVRYEENTGTDKDSTEDEYEEHEENLYFARRLPVEEHETKEHTVAEQNTVYPSSENPKENPENFAVFTARIFAAEGALPVEAAKVIVKRDGEIHSFLLTNGSGETRAVKLEAYPEENSREPFNPDKQMIYTADVYADGFESKKNLLVEATGGSNIILQQFMVPVQQGGN